MSTDFSIKPTETNECGFFTNDWSCHSPFPAAESTPAGMIWDSQADLHTDAQCSPSGSVECCVPARTSRTPSAPVHRLR